MIRKQLAWTGVASTLLIAAAGCAHDKKKAGAVENSLGDPQLAEVLPAGVGVAPPSFAPAAVHAPAEAALPPTQAGSAQALAAKTAAYALAMEHLAPRAATAPAAGASLLPTTPPVSTPAAPLPAATAGPAGNASQAAGGVGPDAPMPAAPAAAPGTLGDANAGISLSSAAAAATPQPPVAGTLAAPVASAVLTPTADPFDALDRKLRKRVTDEPRDAGAQLDYQLLHFLKDEPVPRLESLAALPQEDREVLTALVDALANFRGNVRSDANMLLSRKIRPLVDLSDRLRSKADLTLPNLVLCTEVTRYGVYKPVESTRFAAGKDVPLVLYCEVANFASLPDDKGSWTTKLTYEAALYSDDDRDLKAWSMKAKPVVDVCRNRLHDFFVASIITVPARTLKAGRYLLKVTVVDEQANRVSEATVPLDVFVP